MRVRILLKLSSNLNPATREKCPSAKARGVTSPGYSPAPDLSVLDLKRGPIRLKPMSLDLKFKAFGNSLEWDNHQSGILAIEDGDGHWEPVEIVCSLQEAEEMIASDLRQRSPEADDLCPERYVIFLRAPNGRFNLVGEWHLFTEPAPTL